MANHNADQKRHYNKYRQAILALWDGKCVRCGFSDPRALQVDHVNGDGHLHKKQRNPSTLLKAILKRPNDFQLLCANCNWIKRHERQEW